MEFRILGPLEVRAQDRSLPLGGLKQRALLAVLLLHANEVVSADHLIDELWGEHPPATATHTVQVYVSNLRKVLEAEGDDAGRRRLVTRAPGYVLEADPDELDLERFERLAEEARVALAGGTPELSAEKLRDALALWRGEPLADFAYESFAQPAAARLGELRLAALEERIAADLALGRHAELVGELEAHVAQHPLRERLREQLMLALYRSGRQAEALEVYQETRRVLVEELGIDPSPALQRLERAILAQDPELEVAAAGAAAGPAEAVARAILLVAEDELDLDSLLALAEPLARSRAPHELIAVRVLRRAGDAAPGDELARTMAALNERRAALLEQGVAARVAAFSSFQPGRDLVAFVSRQNVDLVLVAGGEHEGAFPEDLAVVLAEAPCDLALAFTSGREPSDGPVLVPFGAGEHEWAALELGAWLASARSVPLRLLGAVASSEEGGIRDASRLLAHASLAVQQLLGIATETVLGPPGADGVLEAARGAALVVVGLPESWRDSGLGSTRSRLAEGASVPVLFVRRGIRPGGLAPEESHTRFTWSLAPGART